MNQRQPHQQRDGLYHPGLDHDSCGIGFVADIKGRKTRQIIEMGLTALTNLTHRGAVGADPLAGDGAGMLLQIPDRLLRSEMAEQGIDLPPAGEYGVGMIFFPQDPIDRVVCENLLRELVIREGQVVLGWRDVPVDSSCLGESVTAIEPVIRQLFIGRGEGTTDADTFERKLYVIRKQAHTQMAARAPWVIEDGTFYIPTMSARTITYKGMVLAENLSVYYRDLADEADGIGPRTHPPALLHEHLAVVAPRPPVPPPLPQRRDQHDPGEHQLDDGPPREHVFGHPRRRPREALAPHRRWSFRFGHLRQRPRTPPRRRLLARARHDAAHPRGLGRQPADGRRPEGVLRVSRRTHGAVGRAGRRGVHRRTPDRRHPRPQRPAARSLHHHRRRPHRDVLRDGRARHPRREDRREVATPARQDAAHRPRRGPHHRGRGTQGLACLAPSRTSSGWTRPRSTSSTCRPRSRR